MAGIGGVIGGIFGTRSLAKGAAREVGRAALNAGADTLFGQYGLGRKRGSKRRRGRKMVKLQKRPRQKKEGERYVDMLVKTI